MYQRCVKDIAEMCNIYVCFFHDELLIYLFGMNIPQGSPSHLLDLKWWKLAEIFIWLYILLLVFVHNLNDTEYQSILPWSISQIQCWSSLLLLEYIQWKMKIGLIRPSCKSKSYLASKQPLWLMKQIVLLSWYSWFQISISF